MKIQFEEGTLLSGTVNDEPWYSDGVIMVRGTTDKPCYKLGVKMDGVYQQAVTELVPARLYGKSFRTGVTPALLLFPGRQLIQAKYWEMICQPKWERFIGGETSSGRNGERYIVAMRGKTVVAIVCPMRRPL